MMTLKKQLEETHFNLQRSEQKINGYRDTIYNQADRVREQIRANFEMQIDALNQRKQWILNQLELVQSDKLEAILNRQNEIKCSMINIECFMNDLNKYSSLQIENELDKAQSLLLNDLQPFLAFKAETADLRESLSQYGSIINQYCGHFADPNRPSLSLPHMVEDEDDDQESQHASNKSTECKKVNHLSSINNLNKRPNNSDVKNWLLTDIVMNDKAESDTIKSETESFVRVNDYLMASPQIKKFKSDNQIENPKEFWLNRKEKTEKNENFNDVLRIFSEVKKQRNDIWLLSPTGLEEEKEFDYHEFVNKVCVGGGCKSFLECCEKENCCNRLVDPSRPVWNKWLLNNNVITKTLLAADLTESSQNKSGLFHKEFSKIIKSEKTNWLETKSHESDKIKDEEAPVKIHQMALDRWINYGRDELSKSVEKSISHLKLEDDGLKSGSRIKDCSKCVGDCNGSMYNKWSIS